MTPRFRAPFRRHFAGALVALAACGPTAPKPVERGLLDEAPWLRAWLEEPADSAERVTFREPPESEPYRSVLVTGPGLESRAFGREIAARSRPFDAAQWKRTCAAFAGARAARRLRFGFATVGWDAVLVRRHERAILFMKDPFSNAVRIVAGSDLQIEAELTESDPTALTSVWRGVPDAR